MLSKVHVGFGTQTIPNDIADTDDVKRMTKKINGGTIGLEDLMRRYGLTMDVLGMEAPT